MSDMPQGIKNSHLYNLPLFFERNATVRCQIYIDQATAKTILRSLAGWARTADHGGNETGKGKAGRGPGLTEPGHKGMRWPDDLPSLCVFLDSAHTNCGR